MINDLGDKCGVYVYSLYQGVLQLLSSSDFMLWHFHSCIICLLLSCLMTYFYFVGYVVTNDRIIVNYELKKM
jgi:hypothetical protein